MGESMMSCNIFILFTGWSWGNNGRS